MPNCKDVEMKPTFTVHVTDQNPVHTRIKVYNRGGLSGELVVNTADAQELMDRLPDRGLEKTLIKERHLGFKDGAAYEQGFRQRLVNIATTILDVVSHTHLSNLHLCPHGNAAAYPTHGWWCDDCFIELEEALAAIAEREMDNGKTY